MFRSFKTGWRDALERLREKAEKQIPCRLKSARHDNKKTPITAYPSAGSGQALKVRPFKSSGRHFFFVGFDFFAGFDGAAGAGFAALILPWRMARRSASQSFTVWFA